MDLTLLQQMQNRERELEYQITCLTERLAELRKWRSEAQDEEDRRLRQTPLDRSGR